MACVNPDGTLSPSAKQLLGILESPLAPEAIAQEVGQPLFKVRSSLREMADAGLIAEQNGSFQVTDAGRKAI